MIKFLLGVLLGHLISTFITNKRGFEIKIDKKGENITLEPINRPKHKVEFIGEPTRQEVEEAERPKGLHKFFKLFAKPAKEDE